MISSQRIQVLLILLSLFDLNASDRLVLSEGGYGRVLGPQPTPIGSFTVSSWVNVTKFPEGIAPILTYFNSDVKSQIAFFLREDGVGVLWGGPTFAEEDIALASRRPRLLWSEIEDSFKSEKRSKRSAIDYSGGLGDIENILHKRFGKGDNNWSPINFVDVGDMGVADLMVSGSSQRADSVDRSSRAHAYSDWTNVPYELHMAESGVNEDYEDTRNGPESSIITQPSGDADDFVYINWNNPTGAQRQVPLGSNSWSPVWEPTKKVAESDNSNDLYNNVYKGPTVQASTLSETKQKRPLPTVTKSLPIDISNSWNPVNNNFESQVPLPLQTKLLPNKHERPIWPSRSSVPAKNIPVRPVSSEAAISQENLIRNNQKIDQLSLPSREVSNSYGGPEIAPVTIPPKATYSITSTAMPTTSTPMTTTSTTTIPMTTTPLTTVTEKSQISQRNTLLPRRNQIPTLYRYTNDRKERPSMVTTPKIEASTKPTQPPKSRTRVPLWKLIKKPSKSEPQQSKSDNPIEIIEIKPENKKQIFSKPISFTPTDRVLPINQPFNKYHIPEPTLPPIRIPDSSENLQTSASNTRNVYRSRPVHSPARRTLTTTTIPNFITTTTEAPTTPTTRKIPFRPTPITHKVPNYQSSQIEESTSSNVKTTSWNQNSKQINDNIATQLRDSPKVGLRHQSHANEFEKAMQDPEMVREGNRAVVYAVPITNEKEFYDMYKKYQDQSSKVSDDIPNLHNLYNDMRRGSIESNTVEQEAKTKIKVIPYSKIYDKSTTVSNAVVVESTTDKPQTTKPEVEMVTPSRSDIPIQENEPDESHIKNEEKDSESYYEYEEVPLNEDQHYYEYDENEDTITIPQHIEDQEEIAQEEIVNKEVIHEAADQEVSPQIYNKYEDALRPEQNRQTLSELYKPEIVATTSEATDVQPSYFQEVGKLAYEQLPPQYQKVEKQYDFNFSNLGGSPQLGHASNPQLITNNKPSEGILNIPQDIKYSSPNKVISPTFIPPSVEAENTRGDSDRWAVDNQNLKIPLLPHQLPTTLFTQTNPPSSSGFQGQAQIPTLQLPQSLLTHSMANDPSLVPSMSPINSDVIHDLSEVETDEDVEETKLDIHFEKVPYTFRENGWYHLAFTWNALTKVLRVFVNGEKVADISNVLADKSHLDEGGIFLLGKTLLPDLTDFDVSSQFEGEMSDVNLWTTELDSTAVDALFQCKFEPTIPQSLDWETTQMNLYDDAFMMQSPPFCGLVT